VESDLEVGVGEGVRFGAMALGGSHDELVGNKLS